MKANEYNLHDVQVIRVEQKRQCDGQWIAVTVEHKDGVISELCFWPVRGENIAIEFGG
jgi:hypothetical protein